MSEDGPRTDDLEGIALLRSVLADAGFTPSAVRDALATEVATGRDSAELPLYLHMLSEGGLLATLIKLFLLDLEVPATDAEAALAPLALDRLEAMGVLARKGDSVTSCVELVPTDELMIACDAFQKELTRPDHVLGVSPPARVLAWLTIRRHVEDVLDLGTGNGHQALLAARHADRVTAVDINPRALRFAAFNAELNGIGGIELRQGNLFDPVAGAQFDQIVCNPPYVISPENEIVYRDGGLRGDAFCETIVRELPAHLKPGGIAQVLVSWLHPTEGDWTAPIRRWVDGNGCDAIMLRYAAHEPLDYAAAWNRPYRTNPELYAAAIERWSAYFAELGVETISWGALTLRRRDGDNWFFPYSSTTDRITGASEQLLRLFEAQDYLATASPDDLLEGVFSLTDEHRVDQTIRLGEGGALVERNVLALSSGLRFEVSIDQSTERVLSLLDGERELGSILVQVAGTVPGPTTEEFVRSALPVVRRLIELGFVHPPSTPPADEAR
ncbi:MAG TPA: methyltransferase [Gaiellaceae bacterium]|nr:methyltransferase [Gaiellaceae bacterium]